MSHIFQVGDTVRVKKTHLSGDGRNGYPNLSIDFGVKKYVDPDNCFEVVKIHTRQCGGDWTECKRKHGCTGPLDVKRVVTGDILGNPMCLGYTSGFAFELAEQPKALMKELAKLGVECNSENQRYDP